MDQTLTRNKIKNPFFDMSAMSPLSLVSAALSARFYELNSVKPHFPPLSHVALNSNFPVLNLRQFDNILYLKHWRDSSGVRRRYLLQNQYFLVESCSLEFLLVFLHHKSFLLTYLTQLKEILEAKQA